MRIRPDSNRRPMDPITEPLRPGPYCCIGRVTRIGPGTAMYPGKVGAITDSVRPDAGNSCLPMSACPAGLSGGTKKSGDPCRIRTGDLLIDNQASTPGWTEGSSVELALVGGVEPPGLGFGIRAAATGSPTKSPSGGSAGLGSAYRLNRLVR